MSPEVKGSQSLYIRWNGFPRLMFTLRKIKLSLLHRVYLSEAAKHAGHLEVVFEIWLRVSVRLHRLFQRRFDGTGGRGQAIPGQNVNCEKSNVKKPNAKNSNAKKSKCEKAECQKVKMWKSRMPKSQKIKKSKCQKVKCKM